MNTVTSADGTRIVYDRAGSGPALILVNGALTTRTSGSGPALAGGLSQRLTVFSYDRRGRGDSGDTQPYAVQREIEDIEALIGAAGGRAALYGHSSGACLAILAGVSLDDAVNGLALYEPPYNDDPAVRQPWQRYLADLEAALAAGRRGDALALFMGYVGTPPAQIQQMRSGPFWRGLEAIAPTLAYDHAGVMGPDLSVPVALAAKVRVPTLVMYGTSSFPFMEPTARTLAGAIPGATVRALDGQTHDVNPQALAAPILEAFAPP